MINSQLYSNQKGQSLLELIIAIAMIATGLFGVWALFLSNYSGEREAEMHVVGANLAREGVEIVKNIRDSNWLYLDDNSSCSYDGIVNNPCYWDSGLGITNNIIRNLFTENIYLEDNEDDEGNINGQLYVDIDGFYTYEDAGKITPYYRIIILRNICCVDNSPQDLQCDNFHDDFEIKDEDQLCSANSLKIGIDIQSKVSWKIKNNTKSITIQEQLYNWK